MVLFKALLSERQCEACWGGWWGPLSLAPGKLVSGPSLPPSEAACWHPLLSLVS